MIRPTRGGVIALALGALLAALPLAADAAYWLAAVFVLLAMVFGFLCDAVLAPGTRRVTITVDVPPHLYLGDSDPARVTIDAGTGELAHCEMLLDVTPPLSPAPRWLGGVAAGARTEIAVALAPMTRGVGAVERVWLRWTGPLRLVWVETNRPVDASVQVLPNVRAVSRRALALRTPDALAGTKPQRTIAEGTEFESLREYVPGMNHRAIDWKQSARHHKLLCKEFEAERNHPVVVAIDTGHLMREPLVGVPRLDRAINAGLLLAHEAAVMGDLVGLYAFDSQPRMYTPPRMGLAGYRSVQHGCVGLEYGGDETNYALALTQLATRLNRRTLIVLFTEFVDTVTAQLMVEAAGRLALRHLVLCVTFPLPDLDAIVDAPPETLEDLAETAVADSLLRERAVVLGDLENLGVHVVRAETPQVGAALINQYTAFKRLSMI